MSRFETAPTYIDTWDSTFEENVIYQDCPCCNMSNKDVNYSEPGYSVWQLYIRIWPYYDKDNKKDHPKEAELDEIDIFMCCTIWVILVFVSAIIAAIILSTMGIF